VNRHRQTFRRHKIALILPIVIALLASGWYAHSRPYKYEAVMTLWFDNSAGTASSLTDPSPWTTPAGQGQAVLQELFGTAQFLVAAGHAGPLAADLARQYPGASQAAIDGEVGSLLSKSFSATPTGPQVVKVTMTGTDPSYMPGTLAGVATAYRNEVDSDISIRDQASSTYLEAQLAQAEQNLQQADQALTSYQATHPASILANNPTYAQLAAVATQDQTAYSTLETDLQGSQTPPSQSITSPAAFHVVDTPLAAFRESNKKHEIFIVLGGFLAGVVISVLALSALTALDDVVRDQTELQEMPGLEVVAVIPSLRRRKLRALERGAASS
jgi:capsular polysaccharide biosynthesis protein